MMELPRSVKIGLSNEINFKVRKTDTAGHIGSGGLPVLATPTLVANFERVCFQMLESQLPESITSVGISIDVKHISPTPARMGVRIRCEIEEVTDRKIKFELEAWDDIDLISTGTHTRVVIDADRFMQRVSSKQIQCSNQ